MSEYVYIVRSNKPLALNVGLGNMPTITTPTSPPVTGMPTTPGQTVHAEANGAAASTGHRVSMTLESD